MKARNKRYGPKKNDFSEGPYTTHTTGPTPDNKRFVVVNKRGNYVHRLLTPEEAIATKDRWNLKHAEWIMLKE